MCFKKKKYGLMALMMLLMVSCVKDSTPATETFQIVKEKEKVIVGTDHVTISGEYAYAGVIDCFKLRLGTEEHLFGSEDYVSDLNGKAYYLEIAGLQSSTVYYYRYVVDYGGETAWLSEIYFFTTADDEISLPSLVTVDVTGITTTSASCRCNVIASGGAEVVERGACWSIESTPSISNNHFANGAGLGEYTINMEVLEPNATYYVRAYAKNSQGIGYGEVLSFTTKETIEPPLGCVPGLFSVSDEQQVWFSQGNLRYTAATHHWDFAPSTWDIVGEDNTNIAEDYSGPIDLFGWGTSGFDHGAVYYQPWSWDGVQSDYLAYGSAEYNLEDQTGQADWGYGVVIEEGDELTHPWRTLTMEEWNYLLMDRPTMSGLRFAKAQVNGVNGLLILPDSWSTAFYALNNINQAEASYASNRISAMDYEWSLMPSGAVFLPAGGVRDHRYVDMEGVGARYWSGTARGAKYCYCLVFDNEDIHTQTTISRNRGCSVRLVYDCPGR